MHPRLQSGRLGKNHGGIRRDVAVGRITRRLHDDAFEIQSLRQGAVAGHLAERLEHSRADVGKQIHE